MDTINKFSSLLILIFTILVAFKTYQDYQSVKVDKKLTKELHKNTLVRERQLTETKKQTIVLDSLLKKVESYE